MEADLTGQFEAAAKHVAEKGKGLKNDDALKFYGWYKQATTGDCNTAKPGGMFNQKEKAKWEAWNANKGMSGDDAKKAYVDFAKSKLDFSG